MYFALGLATAGLLALMIAPVLWRRAARLTRAKIEHAVPANLSEIQADKDQLRAEFAMSARRLETTIERLRQKAGQQLVDITQKRDLIGRLADEQARRVETLQQLEERESELHNLLRRREDRIAESQAEMDTLRRNLAERGRSLEQLEETLRRSSATTEEQTVELVAKGTEIENLRDHLAASKSRQAAAQIDRTKLESELAEARAAQTVAAQKSETLTRRLSASEAEHNARLGDISTRDREIERLKSEVRDRAATLVALEQRLTDIEGANAEASARISQMTIDLDTLSRVEPSDELKMLTASLESERDGLASELAAQQEIIAKLATENAELQRIAGDEWEAERIQNAMLRERLNDIAGEVARLTNSYQEDMGLSELAALASNDTNGGSKKRRSRSAARTLTTQGH